MKFYLTIAITALMTPILANATTDQCTDKLDSYLETKKEVVDTFRLSSITRQMDRKLSEWEERRNTESDCSIFESTTEQKAMREAQDVMRQSTSN